MQQKQDFFSHCTHSLRRTSEGLIQHFRMYPNILCVELEEGMEINTITLNSLRQNNIRQINARRNVFYNYYVFNIGNMLHSVFKQLLRDHHIPFKDISMLYLSSDEYPHIPSNDVYIEFTESASHEQKQSILEKYHLIPCVNSLDQNLYHFQSNFSEVVDTLRLSALLQQEDGVKIAEPDLITDIANYEHVCMEKI